MNLPGKAFKHDANTGRGTAFPPASLPLKCAHVGRVQLMRVSDMWNDCDNMVCVSGLPDPGLAQLHIAYLSVPDAMAWIQQYR